MKITPDDILKHDVVNTASGKEKKPTFPPHITLIGHGINEVSHRFIKLAVRESGTIVLRTDNLVGAERAFFTRLNQLGAHLVSKKVQNALINAIQESPPSKGLFSVATKLGWHDRYFVNPYVPPQESRIAACFDELNDTFLRKYRTTGSFKAWSEIPRLARGNSRLMLALSLAFVGPLGDILGVEQVGIQLVGPAMAGKTGVAIAAGSVWGCHPDRNLASSRGFAETWNNTTNNLEPVALAHNHTLLILDETRVAKPEALLETVMRLERSSEKGRLTQIGTRSWWVPVLSTSNDTLDALAAKDDITIDDAYRSRLMDLPLPEGCASIFEDRHGFADHAASTKHLIDVAVANHGHAGRLYLQKLQAWRDRDEVELKTWLEKKRAYYIRKAKKRIVTDRDVSRFHEKNATNYCAGRLARRFKVVKWEKGELLEAVLRCEQEIVDSLPPIIRAQPVANGVQHLRDVLRNHRGELADLRTAKSRRTIPTNPIGCIILHKNKTEYIFTEAQFEKLAGGSIEAKALKTELHGQGHIETSSKGKKLRYAVKRRLPGCPKRKYFIVLRNSVRDQKHA